ncbi:MAG: response regulator [Bacilli bacterium]|jgi:two-component system response regulator YesN
MIKILLADDEPIIKRGLREHIDWGALGAKICAEATDGKEALEMIREFKPHIIISDIKMPNKNGLEMMQEAKQICPLCSVIFISGHDEFSYVQKALKLGALDYILKPIDPVYLQERLKEIIESIQTRQEEQSALQISKKAQLRQFLQGIILGNESPVQIQQNPLSRSEEIFQRWFYILSFQIDLYYHIAGERFEQDMDLHRRAFYHLADVFDAKSVYRISESLSSYEICLSGSSKRELKEKLQRGIQLIQGKTETLGFTVTIGVSNPVSSLNDLHVCFHDAQDALELKFMKGGNAIYHTKDYEVYRSSSSGGGQYLPDTEPLMQAMKAGNIADVRREFLVIKENLLSSEDPKRTFHWLSADVLHQIIQILSERGFSIDEVFDNPLSEWEQLGKNQTVTGFSKQFIERLIRITEYIALRRDYHASQILDQAIGYVKKNYQDSSLSLDDVSTSAGMSRCYFAVIFKQQTGKTFNRYLTDLRINKAKDLILYTDERSYEIGLKVGYDNASYFSTVFKKTTGMSPTEYKKRFS